VFRIAVLLGKKKNQSRKTWHVIQVIVFPLKNSA